MKIKKTFRWDNETEEWNIVPNVDDIVPIAGFGLSYDEIVSDKMTELNEFGALGTYLFRMRRIHGSDILEIFLYGKCYAGSTIPDSVPLEDEIRSAMQDIIADAKENKLSSDVDFSKLAVALIRMGYRRAEKAYRIRETGDKLIISVDTETESVEIFVESVYGTVE